MSSGQFLLATSYVLCVLSMCIIQATGSSHYEAYIGENVCLFSVISIAQWLEPCASLQLMVSAFNPSVYKCYRVFVWCF